MNKNNLAIALILAPVSFSAGAATPPDAGQSLQEPRQLAPLPTEAVQPKIDLPAVSAPPKPGGPSVTLTQVTLLGNTLFDNAELNSALGDYVGKSFDMAGMTSLTDRIAQYYRAKGYPFVQVVLPPQEVKDGTLTIRVLEGRYGSVTAAGKDNLPASAQPYLDALLHSGDPIQNKALERALLLLDDQPGMKISPVIRPGTAPGTGDLITNIERQSYYGGELGVDNTGNRYTGQYRAHVKLFANSPFMFGDKVTGALTYTNERMWLGSVEYEAPLNHYGLRGSIGYARTSYQLGAQFAALDANGYANVTSAKLSYPLVRSQALNIVASGTYQYKDLEDRYGTLGLVKNKRSEGLVLAAQFDHRDRIAGGGITYGVVSWSPGRLTLDATQAAADAGTAQTQGSFSKVNLDIARIQKLPGEFSAYGRFSGQWANKNLDSSEQFGLGGFYGVRAYPTGEGMGAKGWLVQGELRYAMGDYTPFVFFDTGSVTVNVSPWAKSSDVSRHISGAGFGVRSQIQGWSIDGTLAWRINGGPAESDTVDRNPRFFLMINYRF